MNLSKRSVFSFELCSPKNSSLSTLRFDKFIVDKELFSGVQTKENINRSSKNIFLFFIHT